MEQTYTGFNLNQGNQDNPVPSSILGTTTGATGTTTPTSSSILPTGNLAAPSAVGSGNLSSGYSNFLKGIFGLSSGIFGGSNSALLGPVGTALAGNPLTGGLAGKTMANAPAAGILGKLF